MILGVPREILANERRVAALPEMVREYVEMGFTVLVESLAGEGAFRSDDEYEQAGARIVADTRTLFVEADVVLKVKQPIFNETTAKHEAAMLREGATLITFLHPAAPASHEMVRMLRDRNITALTMDGIPRTPRGLPMDALTPMSTVTGYKSVLIAANLYPQFIPAIGTNEPARILVVGAGAVGLQAIETAVRLGASVEAADISPAAKEKAESLGATVVGFDVPPELAVGEGRAKVLPREWLKTEREMLKPLIEKSDIVILCTLVQGERALVLVTESMVAGMRPGSVVMDVAVDQGGNCQLTEPGREIRAGRVLIHGAWNIPGSMPVDASRLYADKVLHYVKNLFKNGLETIDMDDEIVRHSLVTHRGQIVHEGALKAMGQSSID